MRIYHYKHDNEDPTKIAVDLVGEIETALGLKLQVDNGDEPNDVHGYMNTSGDGDVIVYLYDQPDIDAIQALPDEAVRHRDIQKVHPISEQEAHDKITNVLEQKGYKLVTE